MADQNGGKWLGAIIGLVVGGPIGAGIGATIGHVIDSSSGGKQKSTSYTGNGIRIQRAWLETNVYQGSDKGFKVHLAFEVHNLRNTELLCFCFFKDSAGRPIRALRDDFQDDQGRVIAGEVFTCPYDSAAYDDFELFIPYDAFDMGASNRLEVFGNIAFLNETQTLATYNNAIVLTLKNGNSLPDRETSNSSRNQNTSRQDWQSSSSRDSRNRLGPEKEKYMKMFGIPRNATKNEIKEILNSEYNKCRARVNSADYNIAQEANRRLLEIGRARSTLLG